MLFCYPFIYLIMPAFFQKRKFKEFAIVTGIFIIAMYWVNLLRLPVYMVRPKFTHFLRYSERQAIEYVPNRILRYIQQSSLHRYDDIAESDTGS